MKIQITFLFLFCSFYQTQTYHNFTQIIVPSVNIQDPYWEFAYQKISQKNDDAFEQLIEKWELILEHQWEKLSDMTHQDLEISADKLSYYLSFHKFIDAYMNLYASWYPEFINNENPQEIDPIVLNFIDLKLQYLQAFKPCQINTLDDFPLMTTSFGADKKCHYLILNENMYNKESIEDLYAIASEKIIRYQIIPPTNFHKSRIIEYSNLLHLGVTQSLSNINHQSDFFDKILQVLMYNDKNFSLKTQKYGSDYLVFLSFIESALQSKNPVEVALFLEPQLDNLHFDFATLWQDFIEDLRSCYNADDLQAYELFSQEERQAALYQDQSDT